MEINLVRIVGGNMKKPERKIASKHYYKTDVTRDKFLEIYMNNMCHVERSCKLFGISKNTYYQWYKRYPDFKEKCDNVVDELKGMVDDSMIRGIKLGNVELIKEARKSLRGTSKFPLGKRINYQFRDLKTLDEIKEARLKMINDFGDGIIDQESVEIINKLLDSLVNNIVATEGSRDLHETKALIKEIKSKENG